MGVSDRWRKEPGPRLQGSRDLDSAKLQAPGVVARPEGGCRVFYTAVGPGKPFANCQGYILSAVSDDGLLFRIEPGIRVAPQPAVTHMSLRVLAPSITRTPEGLWRMYFESRGPADRPTVICSALSSDMLDWEHEEGVRLESPGGLGGPRYLPLPDGGGRLYCCGAEYDEGGLAGSQRLSKGVLSAVTSDGLDFTFEPGYRMRDRQSEYDQVGISAAEVIPPSAGHEGWTMVFSAWQDAPAGSQIPLHPSKDPEAETDGKSDDFAAASIASDMAGYRSRIFVADSSDGLAFGQTRLAIEGAGYRGEGLDAVHAEDMSLIEIGGGRYRMYYAACDAEGNWRVASAVSR